MWTRGSSDGMQDTEKDNQHPTSLQDAGSIPYLSTEFNNTAEDLVKVNFNP